MAAKKKATRKTAAKTAAPAKVPQPHGGALLTGGVPGNKGGTGRPPEWLRDWCDELLASKEAKEQVEAILKDNSHPAYATMWRSVADRAAGKPKERVEHTGEVKHEHRGSLTWGDVEIPL